MNYAIVDIETTGGGPKTSKITEVAIIKHDGEKIIDRYTTLVNPEVSIPRFVVQLTGITDKMVEKAPRFFEIAKNIVEFTEDCVFVAHNVGFDYGIIRKEFKQLGFDYRRPHMCTVKASRIVFPGYKSYGLGKITKELGIELDNHHRAEGDAEATSVLFKMLMEKDVNNLQNFVQKELNPKQMHPQLDLDLLDDIPNRCGIYKFYNDANQLIYIGKSVGIQSRIKQHLRNTKTKKATKMRGEIAKIEYELTGSEAIALIRESQLIKEHQPLYNRRLRRNFFPYGIFDYVDSNGYLCFTLAKNETKDAEPITTFNTLKEGKEYLESKVSEYRLCQKLSNLYKSNSSCFHYEIKECNGACVQQESAEDYNERAQEFIDSLMLENERFYLIGKGRKKGEKSLVLVENGVFQGYGFAPFHFKSAPVHSWRKYIDFYKEDKDIRTILQLILRKKNYIELVEI